MRSGRRLTRSAWTVSMVVILGAVLIMTTAPNSSARDKPPVFMNSVAALNGANLPPESFQCRFQEAPDHDYLCRTTGSGPYDKPLTTRESENRSGWLVRGGNPPEKRGAGSDWRDFGLASPRSFQCNMVRRDGNVTADDYSCLYGENNRFCLHEMVSAMTRIGNEDVENFYPPYGLAPVAAP